MYRYFSFQVISALIITASISIFTLSALTQPKVSSQIVTATGSATGQSIADVEKEALKNAKRNALEYVRNTH